MHDTSASTNGSGTQRPRAQNPVITDTQKLLVHLGAWCDLPPLALHAESSRTPHEAEILPDAMGQQNDQDTVPVPSTTNDIPHYNSNERILSQYSEMTILSVPKAAPSSSRVLELIPLQRWLQESSEESPLSRVYYLPEEHDCQMACDTEK